MPSNRPTRKHWKMNKQNNITYTERMQICNNTIQNTMQYIIYTSVSQCKINTEVLSMLQ